MDAPGQGACPTSLGVMDGASEPVLPVARIGKDYEGMDSWTRTPPALPGWAVVLCIESPVAVSFPRAFVVDAFALRLLRWGNLRSIPAALRWRPFHNAEPAVPDRHGAAPSMEDVLGGGWFVSKKRLANGLRSPRELLQ